MEDLQKPVCALCSTPMEFLQRKDFTSNPTSLLFHDDGPVLDLFVCKKCRRVEFFTAEDDPASSAGAWTLRRCPRCDLEYSVSKDRCPQCGCLYAASVENTDLDGAANPNTSQNSESPEFAEVEPSPKKRGWFHKKEADPWD